MASCPCVAQGHIVGSDVDEQTKAFMKQCSQGAVQTLLQEWGATDKAAIKNRTRYLTVQFKKAARVKK